MDWASDRKNLEKAVYYYKFAAENEYSDAHHDAARSFKKMVGEENKKKADAYFKMGDRSSQSNLMTL